MELTFAKTAWVFLGGVALMGNARSVLLNSSHDGLFIWMVIAALYVMAAIKLCRVTSENEEVMQGALINTHVDPNRSDDNDDDEIALVRICVQPLSWGSRWNLFFNQCRAAWSFLRGKKVNFTFHARKPNTISPRKD